jgi:hypothetical protein
MQHEPPRTEWRQTIPSEVTKILRNAHEAGDRVKLAQAVGMVEARIRQRINAGELVYDTDAALTHAVKAEVERWDSAQGKSADAVLRRTARGELALNMEEDDPFLDTVVTLGRGWRKLWRHVTANDLREMYELRVENHKRQTESLKQFEQDYYIAQPILMEYGTVEEAIRAGAFQVRQVA